MPIAPTLAVLAQAAPPAAPPAINAADTAWILVSTVLVLLMTPALGFFYAGLVRAKNTLNTIMMSVAAIGAVGVAWVIAGYSLSFDAGGFVGHTSHLLLNGIGLEPKGTIPHLLFVAFQGSFAIVTAALVSGAVVERMRFGPYLLFVALWSLLVYAPVAHWVWGGGWLGSLGVLDFAGGTVVHITAGFSGPIAAIVVGARKDYGRQAMLPHSVPFVLLGTALLFVGWFGFNAGSALAANGTAALAFTNTLIAPMTAMLVWLALDWKRTGRATAVGGATGMLIGLVAITPACGFVSPASALAIGAIAAIPSHFAMLRRSRARLDDSLDVMCGHGVGGISGALLTGVFADTNWGSPVPGLLQGGTGLLPLQALGIVAAMAWSATATFVILKAMGLAMRLRASARDEGMGMDVAQHGEEAYTDHEGTVLVFEPEVPAVPVGAAVADRHA